MAVSIDRIERSLYGEGYEVMVRIEGTNQIAGVRLLSFRVETDNLSDVPEEARKVVHAFGLDLVRAVQDPGAVK